ncbi:MAG TPA: CBS domain-containing protein, partial [Pseudolabrys sp.]|nr:CBS domain-containing protein [Pseudolabrys sp.]
AKPAETLAADMAIGDVVKFFTNDPSNRHKSYPVVETDGKLCGIVSRSDVLRWTVEGWPTGQLLRDVVLEQELTTAYEDDLAGRLADRMAAADASRVPILSRHDGAVVGLVARRDLLRVRLQGRRQETEREVLIPLRGGRTSAAAE